MYYKPVRYSDNLSKIVSYLDADSSSTRCQIHFSHILSYGNFFIHTFIIFCCCKGAKFKSYRQKVTTLCRDLTNYASLSTKRAQHSTVHYKAKIELLRLFEFHARKIPIAIKDYTKWYLRDKYISRLLGSYFTK